MSGKLVGAVLRDPLEDAPRRARRALRAVLVALADAAHGDDGLAYPSRATIAAATLLSERQVIRLLHQLEGLGRITCEGHRQGGRGRAPRWRVHPRKGDMAAPIPAPERVTSEPGKGDTIVSPERKVGTAPPLTPPLSGGGLPTDLNLPGMGERETEAGVPSLHRKRRTAAERRAEREAAETAARAAAQRAASAAVDAAMAERSARAEAEQEAAASAEARRAAEEVRRRFVRSRTG